MPVDARRGLGVAPVEIGGDRDPMEPRAAAIAQGRHEAYEKGEQRDFGLCCAASRCPRAPLLAKVTFLFVHY